MASPPILTGCPDRFPWERPLRLELAKPRIGGPRRLLSARDFAQFASERGVHLRADTLLKLWQLSFIPAIRLIDHEPTGDILVVGEDPLNLTHLADLRPTPLPDWRGRVADLAEHSPSSILFHPYQFHVIAELSRVLRLDVGPFQAVYGADPSLRVTRFVVEAAQTYLDSERFAADLRKWNAWSVLCASAASFITEDILGGRRAVCRDEDVNELYRPLLALTRDALSTIGLPALEEYRSLLARNAEIIDPNKDMHLLARMMGAQPRDRLRGSLGGAMVLVEMAETLRRGAEAQFDVLLLEEDEVGLGMVPAGYKSERYGGARLLDGERRVTIEFLRRLGLDHAIRVRWYVEGDTEYGALIEGLRGFPSVEVVNLKGQFVQSGTRGLSFRESLRNDIDAHVFSFVSLDGDRNDTLRQLRKAAAEDELSGMVFVADPDFEFENFTLVELTDALWRCARESTCVDAADRKVLEDAVKSATTGNELWHRARQAVPGLKGGKSKEWGRLLTTIASESNTIRQVTSAVEHALHACTLDYHRQRRMFCIDPQTLQVTKREPHA